jgi:hypothetical protein
VKLTEEEVRTEESLVGRKSSILEQIDELEIADDETYNGAAEYLKLVAGLKKEALAFFKPLKDAANKAHKAITTREKEVVAPLDEARRRISGKLDVYERAREAARRREEEAARLEAEELALAEAAALEEAGLKESAERTLAEVENAPPTAVASAPPPAPKVDGMSVKKTWDFEVLDATAIAPAYLVPDLVAIRKIVKAHGKNAAKLVGGIHVFQRTDRAVR